MLSCVPNTTGVVRLPITTIKHRKLQFSLHENDEHVNYESRCIFSYLINKYIYFGVIITSFFRQCHLVFIHLCCIMKTKLIIYILVLQRSPRCKNLQLRHYMLKPIQRIPQYRMLLSRKSQLPTFLH